jgi:hypothetical protein
MSPRFNSADLARNLTGLVAALVLGTTLVAAAAGPAAVGPAPTNHMTTSVESNIVARG